MSQLQSQVTVKVKHQALVLQADKAPSNTLSAVDNQATAHVVEPRLLTLEQISLDRDDHDDLLLPNECLAGHPNPRRRPKDVNITISVPTLRQPHLHIPLVIRLRM